MIIKLVHKPQEFKTEDNRIVKQTQVFDGVTHYDLLDIKNEKGLFDWNLSFDYKGEIINFKLLDYDEVYIMNNEGKTIDTIRSCIREVILSIDGIKVAERILEGFPNKEKGWSGFKQK